jgi:hypothetical protein
MQKYLNIKVAIIALIVFIIAGCFFGNAAKKTEIKLDNDQTVQLLAEENVKDNNSADQQPEQSADSQKAETPTATDTPKDPAAEPVVSQNSAPKTVDTNAEDTAPAPKFKINNRLVSWGYTKSSGRTIDTIIIHSSYNAVGSDVHDLDDIINKEYKPAGVSPHYIIDRNGKIYRLVADQNIAYHAGVSKVPDGRVSVNDFSIGIEVVEMQSENPSSAQYSSLKSLLSYLKDKYKIKYVLGHSDIAPGRKDDPWNFSWSQIGGKEK